MTEFSVLVYRNKLRQHKKVLLCERKRHTAHRATSVRCADLSWPGGVPTLARGYLPWPGYPAGVDTQTPVKTVPSPILRMWAVIIDRELLFLRATLTKQETKF